MEWCSLATRVNGSAAAVTKSCLPRQWSFRARSHASEVVRCPPPLARAQIGKPSLQLRRSICTVSVGRTCPWTSGNLAFQMAQCCSIAWGAPRSEVYRAMVFWLCAEDIGPAEISVAKVCMLGCGVVRESTPTNFSCCAPSICSRFDGFIDIFVVTAGAC